jgi:hypothetical protein
MSKTVRVKPRPGIILAGIPASGADIDQARAKEWVANGLVILVGESGPETVIPSKRSKPST